MGLSAKRRNKGSKANRRRKRRFWIRKMEEKISPQYKYAKWVENFNKFRRLRDW